MDEGTCPDQARRRFSEEKVQIDGKEQHLHDQQRWCGGEKEASVRTPQIGKRHDIVDAGRQKNEQNPELDQGSVGYELEKDPDDERENDEVGRQQSCEEAQVGHRLAKLGKWDLQEGREQHERECGD